MSDPLPKPTNPTAKTSNQSGKVGSSAQTVFKASLSTDPTVSKPLSTSSSQSVSQQSPPVAASKPGFAKPGLQPSLTPPVPPGQQVQLGGKNIPVPQKPATDSTSIEKPNINPALAPKPAAPIAQSDSPAQPAKPQQAPVFAGKKPADSSIVKKPSTMLKTHSRFAGDITLTTMDQYLKLRDVPWVISKQCEKI